jgi:hypothetical protein
VKHLEPDIRERRAGQRRSDGLNEPSDFLGASLTFGVDLLPPEILAFVDEEMLMTGSREGEILSVGQ